MSSVRCLGFVAVVLSICLLHGGAWGQVESDDKAPMLELKPKHVLKLEGRPRSPSFSRDGKRFACSVEKSALVWDTRTWEKVGGYSDGKHLVTVEHLSPDGKTLAITSSKAVDEIHLLDIASGKVLRTLDGFRHSVAGKFSPDDKVIVTFDSADGLKLWDVETGEDLGRFNDINLKEVYPLVFSPSGETLALGTADGVVHLLDVEKGAEIRQFVPPDPALHSPQGLAFSPDSRLLAVGSRRQNPVIVWDVRTGKLLWQLRWRDSLAQERDLLPHQRPVLRPLGVTALTFTADSQALIVASRRLMVWEMSTGGLRYTADVSAWLLAAAPAGPLFATVSGEQETRQVFIWDSRACAPPLRPSTPVDPAKVWEELGTNNAALAYQRMRELAAAPKDALTLLDKRLPMAEPVKAPTLEKLVRELDDDSFEVRDRARQRLEALGEVAKPALTRALTGDLSEEARKQIKQLLDALDELPASDRLRMFRAVEVLEMIGSPEARGILKRLASGAPEASLTRQAKATLQRFDPN